MNDSKDLLPILALLLREVVRNQAYQREILREVEFLKNQVSSLQQSMHTYNDLDVANNAFLDKLQEVWTSESIIFRAISLIVADAGLDKTQPAVADFLQLLDQMSRVDKGIDGSTAA